MSAEDALRRLGRVTARAPFEYATSWPIEEVLLTRDGGEQLRLLVKRFPGSATPAKPTSVLDPEREATAYRLLADESLTAPRCYASGPGWLVLELVAGTPLWQSGELDDWRAAAGWAAGLHSCFAARLPPGRHLLSHDERFYRRWLERAVRYAGSEVEAISTAASNAIDRLTALPRTLVHGELYPSNVLVGENGVTVVDWEMAALGPGVIDLAALVTGWDADSAAAIGDAFGPCDPADVAAARLVLALQWLGWSDSWDPPGEHRRDWLAEARAAAEALG